MDISASDTFEEIFEFVNQKIKNGIVSVVCYTRTEPIIIKKNAQILIISC